MSLFKRKPKSVSPVVPTTPVEYPDGVCVVTESGRYYIKNGRKYRIKSNAVFKSWSFPLVVPSSEVAISKYKPSLRPLGFRDGTVIRDIFNLELFIIAGGSRVKITSPESAERLGLDTEKVPYASHEDVVFHKEGGVY